MKRAGLRAAILVVVPFSACKLERTENEATAANRVRSDGSSLAPPSRPDVLAAALGVPVDSLRAAGEQRYSEQQYDSARAIWKAEITRSRQVGDRAAEARTHMWLGLAEWHLGDFKAARVDGEAAVAMKRETGLDAELSKSFNALGLLAWHEGRYGDALVMFDSAIVSAKRNRDSGAAARAASNVPLVQVELGNFDAARLGFAKAIEAGRKIGDDQLEANALANLGMLEIRVGNAAKALPLLSEARSRYRKVRDNTGEANALGQLSTAWSQLGDLQRAIASADSGLVIARAEGLQQEVAATLEVLADLQAQAGDLQGSLRLLRSADSLDAVIGLAMEQGTNQRRIAAILTELGEATPAVTHARSALAIHRKVAARNEESYDLMQLAYSYALSADRVAAGSAADSALRVAVAVQNPAAISDAAGVSANLALLTGHPARAISYLDRATATISVDDWRLDDLRASALLRLGRLGEARIAAERALHALERERASLGTGPLRSGYLASRSAPFSHMIEIQLSLHDTAAAFAVAASLPGRALVERLGSVTNPRKSIIVAAAREARLMRIAVLERELAESRRHAEPSEKQRALENAVESARSAFEDQISREAAVPERETLAGGVHDVRAMSKRLGRDEALLLYISGPDRLDIFAVTSRGIRHRSSPVSDRELAQRVRLAREFIGGPANAATVRKPLAELFELLVAPVTKGGGLSGATRLTIVAEGALTALPFAALWDKATRRFLVENYILRYVPSLTRSSNGESVRARRVGELTVFAPIPDSLPATRNEARAISSAFPQTVTLIGNAATETKFRTALLQDRSVHVASHGNHNAQNPLFSRVTVGRRSAVSPSNDGSLEVHEILGLSTNASLVFLSGCETALGYGDGVFVQGSQEESLAEAFLIAGAKTVVATLWRIEDRGAADLAELFYDRLRQGYAPDEALAYAQRQSLAKGEGLTWAAYDVFESHFRN